MSWSRREPTSSTAATSASLRLSGGGGYGDPFERDPELVATDVREGYVTAVAARRDYGVCLTPDTDAPDFEATRRLRSDERATTRQEST